MTEANRGSEFNTITRSSIDFFISYNGKDKTWAEWIAWQLETEGFSTILQAWDFLPGSNFVLKMQEASEQSKRTIAVLSLNYLRADFTQPEWAAAFRQDPKGTKGILVPVMIQDCKKEFEGLWPQIIYINLIGLNEREACKTLLNGLNRGRNKPETPPTFPGTSQHKDAGEPQFPGGVGGASNSHSSKGNPVLPRLKLNKSFNPYKTRDEWIEYITTGLREAIEREASLDFYADDVQGQKQIRILYNQQTLYSLNIYKDSLTSGSGEGISFSSAVGRMILSQGINAWGDFKWDTEEEAVILNFTDLGILSNSYSSDVKRYTKEEFLQALWKKIQSIIENASR